MNRRTFFKVSAAGALVLGVGAAIYSAVAPKGQKGEVRAPALDVNARAAFAAIVPAVLGAVFSADPPTRAAEINATIDRIDAGIRGLSASAQKEVAELLMLLTLKPAHWALTGISNWNDASEADVSKFLQNWRTHRLGLLQVAYHALHDLIGGSHYSDPSTWKRIGFELPVNFRGL